MTLQRGISRKFPSEKAAEVYAGVRDRISAELASAMGRAVIEPNLLTVLKSPTMRAAQIRYQDAFWLLDPFGAIGHESSLLITLPNHSSLRFVSDIPQSEIDQLLRGRHSAFRLI